MRTSLSLSVLLTGLFTGCAADDAADLDGASAARRSDARVELAALVAPPQAVSGLRGARADVSADVDDTSPDEGAPESPHEPEGPVMSWAEPAGEACPAGGTRFVTFTDVNGDGRPGADEPQTVEVRCDEPVSYDALSDSRHIEPGDVCVTGGSAAVSGFDFDFDGALSDAEIAESVATCDAQPLSASVLEGYDVVSSHRGVFAVQASIDESLPLGSHLNWRVTVTDALSGAKVSGLQVAANLGDNASAWTSEVVTDLDGVASLSADASFQLAETGYGASDGEVLMLQFGAMAPGDYALRLEVVPEPAGQALGRVELSMTVER